MPIEPSLFGAFLLTASVIVMSPGPDTLLILRYTLSSGHRVGLATVIGVQIGLLFHTLLAVLGISLIIASSPPLFKAVAVLGAAYLAWLGFQGFRGTGALAVKHDKAGVSAGKAVRDAVLTNLLNPKVIILFLALFPNFVDQSRDDVPAQLIMLSIGLIVINIIWQAPLAWSGKLMERWMTRPWFQTLIGRGTGVILFAFAGLMLWEHFL